MNEKKFIKNIYKVVHKGFCLEYTAHLRDAESVFKESGVDTKMFIVYTDGSSKLLKTK